MKNNIFSAIIKVNNLDEIGFGPLGNLTRREWQAECKKMILTDADTFNEWQSDLLLMDEYPNKIKPNFDYSLEVLINGNYVKNSSDEFRSIFWQTYSDTYIVDLSNEVFTENMNFKNFEFHTGVIFNGCEFQGVCSFDNAKFFRDSYFVGTKFNIVLSNDVDSKMYFLSTQISQL